MYKDPSKQLDNAVGRIIDKYMDMEDEIDAVISKVTKLENEKGAMKRRMKDHKLVAKVTHLSFPVSNRYFPSWATHPDVASEWLGPWRGQVQRWPGNQRQGQRWSPVSLQSGELLATRLREAFLRSCTSMPSGMTPFDRRASA